MLTVHRQQHSFSTHEPVFLWKCQRFWDRKCLDLRRTRTPNLRNHAECSNLLSYKGQAFAAQCFWRWFWRNRYFWSKTNIWNVNCAPATAFIFDTRTGVLVKVSKILRQKMSRPGLLWYILVYLCTVSMPSMIGWTAIPVNSVVKYCVNAVYDWMDYLQYLSIVWLCTVSMPTVIK